MIQWTCGVTHLRRAHIVAAAAFAIAGTLATPAMGIQQRSFVSGQGNDANNCQILTPCRSFAAAIVQTNDGGEIIALDSAGYGNVNVTKSVSIIAPPGVYAGISVFAVDPDGPDGIVVNAPSISVTLRGLFINGQGGRHGVRFVQGARLNIESCEISGMAQNGVSVELDLADVHISDTVSRGNAGHGIAILGQSTAALSRVRAEANGGDGLLARDSAKVSVSDSVFTKNAGNGVTTAANSGVFQSTTRVAVTRSDISHNANGVVGITSNASGNHTLTWLTDSQIGMNVADQVRLDASGTTIVNMTMTGNRLNGDQFTLNSTGATAQAILIVGQNYGPNTACVVNGAGAGILSYQNNGLSCFVAPTSQAQY